jgi:nitronate monooxygenase
MWFRNRLTERLSLDWPIFSAAMTPFATPSLAASVSNAGGLGGLGLTGFSAEDAARRIAGFRQQSGRSLNANFLNWPAPGDLSTTGATMRGRLQPYFDAKGLGTVPIPQVPAGGISPAHMALLQETKPEVVSFHFGLPVTEQLSQIKAFGAMVFACATTVAEARALEAQGADAIIAQGTEAGGHRGTFTGLELSEQAGLFSLLPQVVDAVSVPVIAAGGIADGRTIAAAFMLGASAVHLGTAFLSCPEADIPDAHRAALRNATDTGTKVTRVITGKPARYIKNRLVNELADLEDEAYPFPAQARVTKPLGEDGDPEFLPLYAGQSARLGREKSASELMAILVQETEHCLKKALA